MLLSEPRQPEHEKRGQPEMVQVIGDLDGNLRSVCHGMTHIGRVADDTRPGASATRPWCSASPPAAPRRASPRRSAAPVKNRRPGAFTEVGQKREDRRFVIGRHWSDRDDYAVAQIELLGQVGARCHRSSETGAMRRPETVLERMRIQWPLWPGAHHSSPRRSIRRSSAGWVISSLMPAMITLHPTRPAGRRNRSRMPPSPSAEQRATSSRARCGSAPIARRCRTDSWRVGSSGPPIPRR
jgi:hypothetical protein